jgi:high-affinity iron transporter
VLPTFIIGLREGLEASLIVGIIAAFLIQRREREALRPMWYGVGLAIALCAGVAGILEAVDRSLPHKQQEGLETVLALLAVAGVTYMVVWMKRHSRELKGSLERSAESALKLGSTWALVGMAFFAVLREGLETAVFLVAVFGSSTDPAATGTGAVLGVGVAIVLGYAIYKGGVRINLSRFFRFTGFVLVLVAAGLLASAVHTAHEAGWMDVLQAQAFDLRWLVAPGSVRAALLTGMLGLQPVPTVGETLAWLLYAVPMGLYVLWPARRPVAAERRAAPVTVAS